MEGQGRAGARPEPARALERELGLRGRLPPLPRPGPPGRLIARRVSYRKIKSNSSLLRFVWARGRLTAVSGGVRPRRAVDVRRHHEHLLLPEAGRRPGLLTQGVPGISKYH